MEIKEAKIEDKMYSFENAVEILKNNSKKKFKETIEVSIRFNILPKNQIFNIKGFSCLPNNIDKNYNIAIFSTQKDLILNLDNVIILDEEKIKNINKKNLNFDILITDPSSMTKIGKLTKLLNAKKIMPDMQYGTITTHIKEMIEKINKNYIKFKNDKNTTINSIIGKIDLETKKLKENIEKLINDIKKQKPKNCKVFCIKKVYISKTMGQGLKININSLNI